MSYEMVAFEYYDDVRHPTCRNLRDGSMLAFMELGMERFLAANAICEVGPGLWSAAAELGGLRGSLHNLVLLDNSRAMLTHSARYRSDGAHLVLADAERLPFRNQGIDVVIAGLGDPYNTIDFWDGLSWSLRRGGFCFFTTPSYEWATWFRSGAHKERPGYACFEVINGRAVYLPSLVYSLESQCKMIEQHGMRVVEVVNITVEMLPRPWSPKIIDAPLAEKTPLVVGYRIAKIDAVK
jgi:hypothetical protein